MARGSLRLYYFNYIKKDNYESGTDVEGMGKLIIDGITEDNLSYSTLKSRLNKSSYQLIINNDGYFEIK